MNKKIDWYMIILIVVVIVVIMFLILNLFALDKCRLAIEVMEEKGGVDAVCRWACQFCEYLEDAGVVR